MLFLSPPDVKRIRTAVENRNPEKFKISVDAGFSQTDAELIGRTEILINGKAYSIADLQAASADNRTMWCFCKDKWQKWQRFDPQTNSYYKIVFTAEGRPPTIEISGVKMHVTRNSDPAVDTQNKLKSLGRVNGRILDTCLGLGYSAAACAQLMPVELVVVCEADKTVLHLCKENPWSREIFTSSKIQPILQPAQQFVRNVPDNWFQGVMHDPPRFTLAPELYKVEFYRQLYRVLSRGGKLYHYTGNPNRQVRKRSLVQETRAALRACGFRRVEAAYFGVCAVK